MAKFVPPEIIDDIHNRVDIVALISTYLPLKRRGKNFVGLCPFHSEDTPSFSVSPDKQIYYCFGCQKGGSPINFVMEMESLTLPEAASKLAEQVGVIIPEQEMSPAHNQREQLRKELLRLHEAAATFYQQLLTKSQKGEPACQYLHRRTLQPQVVQAFRLGYAPKGQWEILTNYLLSQGYEESLLDKAGLSGKSSKTGKNYDKFHGRLIFPILDYRGQVVAFGGRVLDDSQPKYLNSPETPIYIKSQHIYGLAQAGKAIRRDDLAVLMEGYMDVLIAHQYGVDNAVAALGTALTEGQARLLRRYSSNILLAYDGDNAGSKAAERALEILRRQDFSINILSLPSGEDPDDFLRRNGRKGWDKLIQDQALSPLEYLYSLAIRQFDRESVAGKAAIVRFLTPALQQTKSHVEKDGFIRQLASRLEVAAETIYADLGKSNRRQNSQSVLTPPRETIPKNQPKLSNLAPLLRLTLEDKDAFAKVTEGPGLDFCRKEEKALLAFVQNLGESYDWRPSSLLPRLSLAQEEAKSAGQETEEKEIEQIRHFLLILLQIEPPQAGKERLAQEYIKTCIILRLQEEIKEIQADLKLDRGETRQLLRQLNQLQRQVQDLRNEDVC
ncbi:MAG: DNA primase [Clostridiales bacterium]|nr:DNA primase [Clostridiales bacterium]